MNRYKIVLGVVLIFALGAVAGSLGTRYYLKQKFYGFYKGDPAQKAAYMMKRMTRELDLNGKQQANIKPILEETYRQMMELRAKHRPEIDRLMETGYSRINEHLTLEQKEQFIEFRKRFRSFNRKHPHPDHPGLRPLTPHPEGSESEKR